MSQELNLILMIQLDVISLLLSKEIDVNFNCLNFKEVLLISKF